MKRIQITYLFFLITLNFFSQEFVNVSDLTEYKEAIKNAKPGTTIILSNGVWSDVSLEAYGNGTKENPITIKAKKAGKVIISGDSKLKIYGEYVVVEGLWFKDGNPSSSTVVSFRKDSKQVANNCRFTNSAISYYNPNYSNFKTKWVNLYGKNNRVDHNNFTGKKNEGATLTVSLKGDENIENNHLIDNNYFGPRTFLDKTNAETIRIGDSKTSTKSSKTIVENNTFEKCDAELEIISNKSCDNIFRNNLFLESKGTLTLRHGDNALVENNVFMGNNVSKTGGVRIINKGHVVRNNLFFGIKGSGMRAPISIMYGVPNSPANRYHQVDNVSIQNNTIINSSTMEFASGKSEERTLAPKNVLFANNLIGKGTMKVLNALDNPESVEFKNNYVETSGEFNRYLFKSKSIEWSEVNAIPMPTKSNSFLVSDFKNESSPQIDITGASKNPFVVGAFNLGNTKVPKALTLKSGPNWDTTVEVVQFKGRIVTVEPGVGTLTKAIKNATGKTKLKLRDGVYYVNREQKINGDITIEGNKKTILISVDDLEKPFKSFFKINGNSKLTIKNVVIDGGVNNIKYGIISPSKGETSLYSLFMDNCTLKNFKHENGYFIKAYTNTTADTISIKNSIFTNGYRGVNFHSKESTTINANFINIDNTVFKSISRFAVKYSKPASIFTSKEKIVISNCVFSEVNNRDSGNIIEIKNITNVAIKNSVFEKSRDIVNTVSLSGNKNVISNCLIYGSGEVKISKGARQRDILYKKPKWKDKINFTPNKRSPLLKENNYVDTIGLY